jgi:uncharacterized protein YndB with AHSA1/START domain
MKWIRRGLLVLLAIPVLAVVLLVVAGQRSEAGRTRAQLVIDRSPEVVFRHIEDPELLQKWTGLHEVVLLGEPPLRVGSRARASVVARGRRTDLESEVTALERDRLLALAMRTTGDAPVHLAVLSQYALEERDGRTHLTVTADTSYQGLVAGLLEPLMTGAAQRELERQLARLKAQVEAEGATSAPPVPDTTASTP